MNETVNAKCPHCGAEINVDTSLKESVCLKCGEKFNVTQAVKYYSTMSGQKGIDLKEAHGEDFLLVERYLDQINDYIASDNYYKAKETADAALKLTESDYRVWMAYVRIRTENYKDLTDKEHKKYLEKAIEVADADQKKSITKEYKPYYLKTKLTEEELKNYSEEDIKIKNKKLEDKLKNLIPDFLAKEKRNKIFLCIFPELLLTGVVFAILGFIFEFNYFIYLIPFASILAGYILFRNWFLSRDYVKAFNELLDLYDAMNGFALEADDFLKLVSLMLKTSEKFEDNDPLVTFSDYFKNMTEIILKGNNKAVEFAQNNKFFAEYVEIG